jgi:predicted phosphoribosyltransferase
MRPFETFRDRADAGRALAEALWKFADRNDVVVLALPRGGVPVGFEVARALHTPLDVFLVRKLGVPGYEELAMGAIAAGGITVLNPDVIRALEVPRSAVEDVAVREREELERRARMYRRTRPPLNAQGKASILVDDGLATGSTMRAAVAALRRMAPSKIVVAVPIASPATCEEMRRIADECVCVETPHPFQSVGLWYDDFSQTTDEEVCALLDRADARTSVPART